jgi:spectrin beta
VSSHGIANGEVLINDCNPKSGIIKTKRDETKQLWEELKDLVTARQEALAGAKQVHVYDRTADETISWINEKIGTLLSEDYGQDQETIQALVRKHEGFETELGAVKEQIEAVVNEARKLGDTFPDAKEHIEVKKEETIEIWSELIDRNHQRKEKLMQAEQLQAYFDEYPDLMAWINEMWAKITEYPDLMAWINEMWAKDVQGAEALIVKIASRRDRSQARGFRQIFQRWS